MYLDQKDFVRVVHGLGGRTEYRVDVEVYRELEALVDYIVTDRFAAEMVKSVAGRYGTVVVKSLSELSERLAEAR